MPYIIALAVLVVASIGFTVFQSTQTPADTSVNEQVQEEVLVVAPVDNSTLESNDEAEIEDNDENEDEDDDDSLVTTQPATKPEVVQETTPVVTKPVATEPTPTPSPAPTPIATSDYINGSYTSSVTYRTPERDTYTMDVTLTIKNDTVTATDIIYGQGAQRDSYARRFDGAYESYVVGKDLDSLSLSRVGGASLTTKAFNQAVNNIKLDAAS